MATRDDCRTLVSRARLLGVTALVLMLSGCSKPNAEYYPLGVGKWWHYQTRTTILGEESNARIIIANLESGSVDGEPIVVQRRQDGRDHYVARLDDGVVRLGVRDEAALEVDRDDPPIAILPGQLELGSSWNTQSVLALVESRTFAREDKLRERRVRLELTMAVASLDDEVAVPAGRYRNCLRVDGTGETRVWTDRRNAIAEVHVELHDWYAPGVGLVKSSRLESSESPFLKGGESVQELVQFGD
jgi:hypothetical protein